MLSNKLKELRKTTTLTQSEFAKKIDVARTTYAMYEQGNREPDYEILKKIADFYNVTIDFLLGRGNNDFTTQQLFSHRLGNSRRDKNMTADDISKKLQIPVDKYKKFEQELTIPDSETLKMIVKITGVSLEYLFGLTDDTGLKSTVITDQENNFTEDEEFEAFANNPDLERWYKDLPNSEEEDLEALKQMWEIIKKNR